MHAQIVTKALLGKNYFVLQYMTMQCNYSKCAFQGGQTEASSIERLHSNIVKW